MLTNTAQWSLTPPSTPDPALFQIQRDKYFNDTRPWLQLLAPLSSRIHGHFPFFLMDIMVTSLHSSEQKKIQGHSAPGFDDLGAMNSVPKDPVIQILPTPTASSTSRIPCPPLFPEIEPPQNLIRLLTHSSITTWETDPLRRKLAPGSLPGTHLPRASLMLA